MWTAENRPRYNRDKLRYPSDLTDQEWGWALDADVSIAAIAIASAAITVAASVLATLGARRTYY